ncbi:MAG: hypothetical protein AABW59_00750 [archaeon]
MAPLLYSRTVSRILNEIRKHIPSNLNKPKPNMGAGHFNKPTQRIIQAGARLKIKKVFVRPIERKIALEIFAEIMRGPVFMEDLTTRISSMHKYDRLGFDWRSTTPNGVRAIYFKMVKAKMIKEKK